MSSLPTLGHPPRSGRAALAVGVLLVASVGGGFYVKARRTAAEQARVAADAALRALAEAQADAARIAAASGPEARAPGSDRPEDQAGVHRLSLRIDGPLERGIVASAGRAVGLPLTQVVARALVWWVDVPSDFRKGDVIDVLYELRPGEEPLIHAVRFHSAKMAKQFRAYRFQPAGARFARLYQPDGSELELRLEDAPLDDYEQVTSLLRDGRGHKGVDFKTPVGTPVRATFDGTVLRRTWNFQMNGNSLEVREDGGQRRVAALLHLSDLAPAAQVGAHVKRGQVIAHSGNTGHSFAPHLHYQLETPRRSILDPFASQATTRRSLPAEQKAAFDAEVHRLDALLGVGEAGT